MSDISSRIAKLGKYFVSFNVVAEEAAAYVIMRFPNGWSLPDQARMKEIFGIELAPIEGGLCFVTEITNGSDKLFDAADYVIDFNQQLEVRKSMLQEKIKELKNIFASETVDKLKTLKFVFEPQKKKRVPASKKKEEGVVTEAEPQTENGNAEVVATEDNSLMAFAKDIAGE